MEWGRRRGLLCVRETPERPMEEDLMWWHTDGYHNLFFGWIDTARDNFPPPLTGELLMIGFAIADKLIPSTIDRVWNEALNMRTFFAISLQRGSFLGARWVFFSCC